jgi:hypothetical protein
MKKSKKTVQLKGKGLSLVSSKENKELIYENDFFRWTLEQADFLQKGEFEKLDIDHLREEIESLGISQQRALESYISSLLMHKLKIQYQPAKHTNSWDNTIKNALFHIEKTIKKNPSLKSYLPEIFEDAYYSARLDASSETGLAEETFPKECQWKLKDLFPFLEVKKRK